MKVNLKLFSVFMSCLFFSLAYSQNNYGKSDDDARIVLNTFIPDDILESTPSARKLFTTKVSQIASMNGLGGSKVNTNNRFIITGDLNILTKDVLPTAPPKYAVTIETNLAVGDGIDGKSFASEFVEFKGIGISEDKAFIAAIRKINPRHKMVKELLEKGKQKIIEYYNTQCDFILKEANTLADQKEFDSSISKLIEVPEVCKECYDKAMDLSSVIYKRKIENECQQNLTKSNSLIAQDNWEEAAVPISSYTPDMSCYSEVKQLLSKIGDHKCSISLGKAKGAWARRDSKSAAIALSEISFDSSCYQEGVKLFKSISTELDSKAKQEWDLKYEKYNRDQMIKEVVAESQRGINELNAKTQRKINSLDAESRRKVQEEMVNVEKRRIDAMRDVGVAYGKNQPRTVTYRSILQ